MKKETWKIIGGLSLCIIVSISVMLLLWTPSAIVTKFPTIDTTMVSEYDNWTLEEYAVNVTIDYTNGTYTPQTIDVNFILRRTDSGWRENGKTVPIAIYPTLEYYYQSWWTIDWTCNGQSPWESFDLLPGQSAHCNFVLHFDEPSEYNPGYITTHEFNFRFETVDEYGILYKGGGFLRVNVNW